ncbi:Ubiquinone biosynthesis protein COQ9, mitochondrial [Porphyridium purpureum]|uniref:Ubiquinone biosynthesis protein n=1 Tax=Porphyridium purpureum TaxID=35688 RepID=A0A5J4YTU9_PORPP|nr:Ubiquinone biosynthesis protein COQ9, mitochondrial [Porphyridium purpureum]|eukprot:POR1788..scf236_6
MARMPARPLARHVRSYLRTDILQVAHARPPGTWVLTRSLCCAEHVRAATCYVQVAVPNRFAQGVTARRHTRACATKAGAKDGDVGTEKEPVAGSGATREEPPQQPSSEERSATSMKERIAEHALRHVMSLGWTQGALEKAAGELDLSPAAAGMFPRGGVELVEYFTQQCNAELARSLKESLTSEASKSERATEQDGAAEGHSENQSQPETQKEAHDDRDEESIKDEQREKIAQAIQRRIMMIEPYRARWSEAIALQALPQNAPTALRQAAELADELCVYADALAQRPDDYGKRIDDWYVRRAAVGAIVQAVQLAWLSDSSPDFEKTWTLLRRMLHTASAMDATLSETADKLRAPAEAAIQTIQSLVRSFRGGF